MFILRSISKPIAAGVVFAVLLLSGSELSHASHANPADDKNVAPGKKVNMIRSYKKRYEDWFHAKHSRDKNLRSGKKVTIISSYRKHYQDVLVAIDKFESMGVKVLMPPKSRPVDPSADFIMFETDKNKTQRQIEDAFLESIKKADFVYVLNKGGYVGLSSSIEMGYAIALNKPVYCAAPLLDAGFPHACSEVLPLELIQA